jgi:hypothetical protein
MERVSIAAVLFFCASCASVALRTPASPTVTQQQLRSLFFGARGLAWTPNQAEAAAAATGDQGKGDTAKDAQGGLAMQVPEEELASFLGELSIGCKKQFTAMLKGSGTGLHTFEVDGASNATEESCQKLDGGLCFTQANVEEEAERAGRSMHTRVDVEGTGCLPSQCIAKYDLQQVAKFMKMKAKENLPGNGVTVQLHVNCTEIGGGVAEA